MSLQSKKVLRVLVLMKSLMADLVEVARDWYSLHLAGRKGVVARFKSLRFRFCMIIPLRSRIISSESQRQGAPRFCSSE